MNGCVFCEIRNRFIAMKLELEAIKGWELAKKAVAVNDLPSEHKHFFSGVHARRFYSSPLSFRSGNLWCHFYTSCGKPSFFHREIPASI